MPGREPAPRGRVIFGPGLLLAATGVGAEIMPEKQTFEIPQQLRELA
jgi:hypothetical protein